MKTPLRIVGLDLSLTSTGMSDGRFRRVSQTSPGPVAEERLDRLVRDVVRFVLSSTHPSMVVIEGSSFNSHGPGHEELAALRVMVRHRMWRLHIPYALVPPTALKKYVTGNGRASKQDMVAAVDERFGAGLARVTVSAGRYDLADATGLAAMGYEYTGQPLNGSQSGPDALSGIVWPDLFSDD